ncbi:MAG: thiamine pyrophosphate-binding protein [Chloroflexi bacterium]|nr:thiamine pyrophosphate-binding protein [Chloroflexota bacterium]
MTVMKGKDALVTMLQAEGVRYVFGNPGTTELPLLDAIQDSPQLRYITGLQEATPLFMADGYARSTGRPAFVNVHVTAGLGNTVGALYNVFKGGTPLVLTAGQSSTRQLLREPVLGSNMVNVVREHTKWAAEVIHPEDISVAVRRAFKVAKTPPTGPVFLSLPWDVLDQEADFLDLKASSEGYFRVRPDVAAVERAAHLLAGAHNPVMLVSDRVAQSGASAAAVRVAEQLGTRVYATQFAEVNFPTAHPQFMGMLNLSWPGPGVRDTLAQADVILAVGTNVVGQFTDTPEPLVGPQARIVHLDSSAWEIEKTYPVEAALWCDPLAGLLELSVALEGEMSATQREAARTRAATIGEESRRRREAFQKRLRARWGHVPISPERMMWELRGALPPQAIIADESITCRGTLMQSVDFAKEGDMFAIRGGGLGWAMPGALGIQLAQPDRSVVAVVGDGAAMYTIQALWTAARYHIPVTYVMCNNRSYKVLKEGTARYLAGTDRVSEYVGMNFHELPLDFVKLGEAFGIQGVRVEDPEALGPALRDSMGSGEPRMVDVVIDDTVAVQDLQAEWAGWFAGRPAS